MQFNRNLVMLKWTVVNQKPIDVMDTPKQLTRNFKRRKSLISCNKENIITSTPFRKNALSNKSIPETSEIKNINNLPATPPVYASTLPKFAEEYSPSPKIRSGQEIAMRGLLPDIYLGNPRYLSRSLTQSGEAVAPTTAVEQPSFNSTKMGDHTLDKLIDAILESGKKSLRKGTRRSMNLRRRTLLKTAPQTPEVLSPSYKAGDDPASDLSFSKEFRRKRKSVSPLATDSPSKRRKSELISSPRLSKRNSDGNANYFEVGLAMPSIYV